VISQIRTSINDLILEIFVDETGKPSVNAIANSLVRIRDTFFPILKDKITKISLPTLEFDSKRYFFRISDIKINTSDLIPDQLKIESDFNLSIDLNEFKRKGDFTVRVILDPFSADVEGLKFFIKKKSGIKYKDYGTVNIYLRESSLLMELHVRLLKDEVDYIELSRVETDLSGLKVKIDEAKHDIIDKMVLSIFLPTIRLKLQNMINSALYDNINKGVFDRVNNSLKELHHQKKTKKSSNNIFHLLVSHGPHMRHRKGWIGTNHQLQNFTDNIEIGSQRAVLLPTSNHHISEGRRDGGVEQRA